MKIRRFLAATVAAVGVPLAVIGGLFATTEMVSVSRAGTAHADGCNTPLVGPAGGSYQDCWTAQPDGSAQWCHILAGPRGRQLPFGCWNTPPPQ